MSAWGATALVLAALLSLGSSRPVAAAEIRGKVIHATRPEAGAEVEVRLLGLAGDDEPFQRRTRTDAEGEYLFADLPAPAAYLVAATFDGISFPGGTVSFRDGEAPARPPLVFHIYDRGGDASALGVPSLRWIVEREAGVYQVTQSLAVKNSSTRVVVAEAGEPALLRMPLAPGHAEVRATFGRLPEGVTILDGAAELRGPFLPGETELRLTYDLAAHDPLQTEIGALEPTGIDGPWPAGAPRIERLELYLKDFGIKVAAGSLRPARPTRDGDVIYLAYLGFELEPGRRFPIRISPLPPANPAPGWANVLLVSLLAGGSLYLVARPIAAAHPAQARPDTQREEVERDALRTALADLDFDYETGKLSTEDRDQLREELRREAVRSLARRRRAPMAKAQAPLRRCTCGHQPQPGDKFCAACGKER